MNPLFFALRERFRTHADPEKAGPMEAYMKHHFAFLGIKSPERKVLQQDFLNTVVGSDKIVPQDLIDELWEQPEREYQYVALELLEKYARKAPAHYIDWYENLITHKSWWDSVDMLCNVVWKHFLTYPELRVPYTLRWIESDNMWLQRTALIFQRKAKAQTDWPMLQDYILRVCHSREFFIQKAIGWALREYSKTAPERVAAFIEQHREQLPPLSIREGSKYI